MKRYFQPLATSSASKRLQTDDSGRLRNSATTSSQNTVHPPSGLSSRPVVDFSPRPDEIQNGGRNPSSFMTWNANSLLLRMKNDIVEFRKFVEEHDPDIVAIQEVRIPSAGKRGESKNPCQMKDDTSEALKDKQVMDKALASPPLHRFKAYWSLAAIKYAGVCVLVKRDLAVERVSYCIPPTKDHVPGRPSSQSSHEPDGRAILLEFPKLRVLSTYVPMNGWKDDDGGMKRRREWDRRMASFLEGEDEKPLIWLGDLNVAHKSDDVSHPDFFRNARDTSKYIPPDPQDAGQPGFTVNEQKRFEELLARGTLLDAYRLQNPNKDFEGGFTWCGHPVGKYRGKRMRIDYFLVGEALRERIKSVRIHGRGDNREGYLGSDHCPMTMELYPDPTDPPTEETPLSHAEPPGDKGNKEGIPDLTIVNECAPGLKEHIKQKSAAINPSAKKESTSVYERPYDGGDGEEKSKTCQPNSSFNGSGSPIQTALKFPPHQSENPSTLSRFKIGTGDVASTRRAGFGVRELESSVGNHTQGDVGNIGTNPHVGVSTTSTKVSSSAWAENPPLSSKKKARVDNVFEGKVPDPALKNSGGFFW